MIELIQDTLIETYNFSSAMYIFEKFRLLQLGITLYNLNK